MKFGLKDSIVEILTSAIAGYPTVKRVVVFGSRARGDNKYNSDIDIAVYTEVGMPSGLRAALDKAAGIYKIDVVDMVNLKNESLRIRIEEEGIEIYNINN